MSKLVLTNAYVAIGGVDISEFVTGISISTSYDIFETTQIDDFSKKYVPGLAENKISIDFLQDFDPTDGLEKIINNTVGSLLGTVQSMEIRPLNAGVSSSNPKYTFLVVVSEWTSISASIGELSTVSVNWPISGDITKSIS
jgi:hypothetical protein